MTDTMRAPTTPAGLTIRSYRPSDHGAGRRLWAELIEHRRLLYRDPRLGGRDPGAGFEEYLTRLDLSGIWVADEPEEGVVGFVGLILEGRGGELDPIVVAGDRRGLGIGRALVAKVADEARRRGLARLTVSPSARDGSALHSLHAAGFGALSTVTLSLELRGPRPVDDEGPDEIHLHGLPFTV
jgi:GNAT superfamily N-acetyltransferase